MSQNNANLLQVILEDWAAHDHDWSRPGFRALLVHRFGNWRMGVEPKLARAPFSVLYRALYRRIRNYYGIELPYSARVGRRVVIEHQGCIVIHGNSEIGDDCVIRQGVTLGNRRMDRPHDAPTLGKGVSVGSGAKVLGAVKVGDHASIGANAVVLEDVSARTAVGGIPAHPLRPHGGQPRPRRGDVAAVPDRVATATPIAATEVPEEEQSGMHPRWEPQSADGTRDSRH